MTPLRWIIVGAKLAVSVFTVFMWHDVRPYHDEMTADYSAAARGAADVGEAVTVLAIAAFFIVISTILMIFMAGGPENKNRTEAC